MVTIDKCYTTTTFHEDLDDNATTSTSYYFNDDNATTAIGHYNYIDDGYDDIICYSSPQKETKKNPISQSFIDTMRNFIKPEEKIFQSINFNKQIDNKNRALSKLGKCLRNYQ